MVKGETFEPKPNHQQGEAVQSLGDTSSREQDQPVSTTSLKQNKLGRLKLGNQASIAGAP